jgi:hypothetical protein
VKSKLPDSIADCRVRYALIHGASAWRKDDRLSNYHENDRRIMGFCRYLEENNLEEIALFHKFEKQIERWAGHENWHSWRHFHISEKDEIELDEYLESLDS